MGTNLTLDFNTEENRIRIFWKIRMALHC